MVFFQKNRYKFLLSISKFSAVISELTLFDQACNILYILCSVLILNLSHLCNSFVALHCHDVFHDNNDERRMVKKSKTLIFGIVSGVVCVLAVLVFMQSVQSAAEASRKEALTRFGGEQIEVCVAQRYIAAGEKIDASNTTTKLWVADLAPEGAVHSFSDVAGKEVSSSVLAGEVISDKRFENSQVTIEIPEGLCAISVPAKDVQTVGGSLSAGMRVDLYATGTSTDLLDEDVLVLTTNVEESQGKSGDSVSWVTLALDPDSVQEVITASQKLELYFALPSSKEKRKS